MPTELLNTKETAETLRYGNVHSVYRLVERGLLEPVRLTPTGPLLFRRDDIEKLLERARTPRTAPAAAVEPSTASALEGPRLFASGPDSFSEDAAA